MPEYRIDSTEDLPLWKRRLGMFTRQQDGLGGEGDDHDGQGQGGDQHDDTDDDGGDFEPDLDNDEGPGEDDDDFSPEPDLDGGDEAPTPELVDDGPTLDQIRALQAKIIEQTNEAGDIIREFASWYEFVKCVTDPTLNAWGTRHQSSHRTNDSGWSGTPTWEDAVRMATITGWPEGRKLLTDQLAIVRPKPEPYKSIEYSVAGAFPMVPNYCAGDPECMVIDPGADIRNSKPIVRIDYNHWIHAGVTVEAMMLRGAAVISLAETLEARGYSTELRIIGNTQSYARGRVKTWRYSIVYKRAGEPLDLDRAAFAIAHPASMRRLAFALLEQSPTLVEFYPGYGMPLGQPNDKLSDGTIFVPGVLGRETPETARQAVQSAAETVLNEISESESRGGN